MFTDMMLAPLLERVLLERGEESREVRRLRGGVVVEDVHAAQLVHDSRHHRARRTQGSAMSQPRPSALQSALGLEFVGERPARVTIEIDDCDVGAELGEASAEAPARDAEAAGDDGDLAVQVEEVSIA